MPRITVFISFDSAQLLLAFSEQSALGTFSSLLPPGLAALLRSAGFFSGAVCFFRMTLARSALIGFEIGFKRSKGAKECRFDGPQKMLKNELPLAI